MPIPDYQSMMLPALSCLADGASHELRDLISCVADRLKLTEDERTEPNDSGRGTKLYGRAQWAYTYMAQAGLLDKQERGVYRITDAGQTLLSENLDRIDNRILKRYASFVSFITRSSPTEAPTVSAVAEEESLDPDSMIDDAVRRIRASTVDELLTRLAQMEPGAFERFTLRMLERLGYGIGRLTGGSGDRGIDGVLEGDALGLSRVYVQCKRFTSSSVGGPEIRSFIGALHQQHAQQGVFVTCGTFSSEAKAAAKEASYAIALIDGRRMAELMYDRGLGVLNEREVVTKRIDESWFQ